jgi:hypothetical protein
LARYLWVLRQGLEAPEKATAASGSHEKAGEEAYGVPATARSSDDPDSVTAATTSPRGHHRLLRLLSQVQRNSYELSSSSFSLVPLSLSLEPSTWLSSGRCLTLTPACPHITGGARAIRGQQHLRHPAVPARRGAGGRGHVGDGRHAHGRRGPGRALGRVAGRRRPFATAHSVALAVTLQRRQPHTFVFALLRSVAFLWLLSHQASKSGWGDVTEHISYRLTLLFEGADAGEWRGATVTPHGAAALHLTDRYVHSSHPSLMHDVTPRVSACVLARTV